MIQLGVIDYSSYLKEVVPSENAVETPAKRFIC